MDGGLGATPPTSWGRAVDRGGELASTPCRRHGQKLVHYIRLTARFRQEGFVSNLCQQFMTKNGTPVAAAINCPAVSTHSPTFDAQCFISTGNSFDAHPHQPLPLQLPFPLSLATFAASISTENISFSTLQHNTYITIQQLYIFTVL